MTELTTIDPNNYAAMAKAMGIAHEGTGKAKSSSLARLRINHSPVMGTAEVKGKNVNVEVVSGGTYKLEIPDGPTYYATSIKLRPFMQRFMYKRFIMGNASSPNRYIKTIMHDDLNVDLKDNDGGFNCGKPAGYIQDFKALPEKTQELIKQIKRVRVVLGTVELVSATDEKGNSVDVDATPFIWEIDNRDAFKTMAEPFKKFSQVKRLPVQHTITLNTEERKLPNGNSFYLPTYTLDLQNHVEVSKEDQDTFIDFMAWIDNYNSYIYNEWDMKTKKDVSKEDMDTVDDFIDVEMEASK
jgi:hypothetical protein